MAAWKDHWPLARRWAFVKRRLLQLPQESHDMEIDFCPLPDDVCDELGLWLGLVVDHDFGLILMTSILDEPPVVQDLLEIRERSDKLNATEVWHSRGGSCSVASSH